MSEKKDKKSNSDKLFTLSRRGRLSLERMASRRNIWIILISLFSIIVIFSFLSIVVNILQDVTDENLRLSTIIAVILVSQLIFILFQTVNQINTNRYNRIQCLPRISINAELKPIKSNRRRKVGEKLFLSLLNNGMDAHNVSYAIKIDKRYTRSKIPLFLLSQNTEKEIYSISKTSFKRKKIDISVTFEDMTNFQRNIKFRKDKGNVDFRTIDTGFW